MRLTAAALVTTWFCLFATPGEAQRLKSGPGRGAQSASSARLQAARAKSPATQGATSRRLVLAKDPAHNKLRLDEADAVLAAEAQGLITAPVTRSAHPSADFIDGAGQRWDVKAFRSPEFLPKQVLRHKQPTRAAGAFDLAASLTLIAKEVKVGQKVIIDTRFMSGPDLASLRAAIAGGSYRNEVIWVAPAQ